MRVIKRESELALQAMHRAARIAREKAAEKNLKIPVWKDGSIVYEDPKKNSQQEAAPRQRPRSPVDEADRSTHKR